MSSNSNHTNIHRGNYEEFFILYLDNELTTEQKEMVDQFLEVHPDLQAELELLMSTKLSPEEFILADKESLLADSMKLTTAEEELLLYIDDELDAEKTQELQKKLQIDQPLQHRHQLLLKTKLDASEKISYPNKEELYRRTERRILPFRRYMSAAAVVLVIGFIGVIYWTVPQVDPSAEGPIVIQPTTDKNNETSTASKQAVNGPNQAEDRPNASDENRNGKGAVVTATTPKKNHISPVAEVKNLSSGDLARVGAHAEPSVQVPVERNASDALDVSSMGSVASAPKQILNNAIVTSSLAERNTIVNATPVLSPDPEPGDETARKGSIKGFLRKATRLVERTTGITATNEDGELLIGAVAVKLN